jgi:hypothetical protein
MRQCIMTSPCVDSGRQKTHVIRDLPAKSGKSVSICRRLLLLAGCIWKVLHSLIYKVNTTHVVSWEGSQSHIPDSMDFLKIGMSAHFAETLFIEEPCPDV